MTDTLALPEFFDAPPPPPKVGDPLTSDLIGMINARYAVTPRHLQVELGPSEVGHPCMRKMAYGMMAVDRCNPELDPLPSIIGTATHSWLQSAASHANNVLGRQRWLAETKVNVCPGLSGSCDLYDCDTATVIDWKVPGENRFKIYKEDPGPVFKGQVHLYGRGFENAGLPVKRVAIALLPRGKTLRSMHLWQADYDPKLADEILARRDQVIGLLDDFRIDEHPERYEWIPTAPYDCIFCPWWSPHPRTPTECPGDQ